MLLLFLVFGCQKDISFSGNGAIAATDSTFLVRVGDHFLGDTTNIELYLYVDFESPESRETYYFMKDIIADYKDSGVSIALVLRHFPMDTVRNHHRARVEALAAECISYQKHDSVFFSAIEDFFATFLSNDARLESVALAHGVPRSQFWTRMGDPYFKLKIEAHIIEGIKNRFKGAPTTFVVGKQGKLLSTIEGKKTKAELREIINLYL